MSGFDEMMKRFELLNSQEYKTDMDYLVLQIDSFLAKYSYKGIMGFYRNDKFIFSILPNAESVEMNIVHPENK